MFLGKKITLPRVEVGSVCVWCVGGCVAKLGFRKKSGLVRGLGFRVRNLII